MTVRAGLTRFALGVSALASATAVELGRQSGVPAWHSLWAEDGAIFLSDAVNRPFHDVLFEPINGYMLLVPRVAAEVVALFPLANAAWITALIASALVAAVAVFVFHASSTILTHRASRFALAAAVLLVPAAAFETTANLANVHWYLIFACFWALLYPRRTPGVLGVRTVFALLAPLSNPIALFLAPLLLRRPDGWVEKRELVPRLAFVIGLGIQGLVVLRAPSDASDAITTPFNAGDLPPIFAVRVAGSFLVGDRFLELAWLHLGSAFEIGAVLGAGAILTAAVRALDWPRLSVALIALAAGVAYFTLPLAIRGTSEIWPAFETPNLGGSRYFVLPVLFLTLVLLLGLDARLEVASQQSSDPWLTGIALWLASLALLNYSIPNPRTPGPDWLTTLRQAQGTCAAGQRAFVYVPIPPGGTWSVRTPCPR